MNKRKCRFTVAYKLFTVQTALLLAAGCCGLGLISCAESGKESDVQTSAAETGMTESSKAPAAAEHPFDAEGMHFSAKSGFYDSDFLLTISAGDDTAIYYTLDGSNPTEKSTRYTDPIPITDRSGEPDVFSQYLDIAPAGGYSEYTAPKKPSVKATVVKAMTVSNTGEAGHIVSCTYFVGFREKAGYYQNMKIISLMTDAQNLFDDESGIYVLGKTFRDWRNSDDYDPETPEWFIPGNYTQKGRGWERNAAMQIFEHGEPAVTQNVGIRIHGGATRSYPQKSLNLYARSAYGAPKLNYDLFSGAVISEHSGKPVTEYDAFMLRNGGNDAQYTRFRDKLNQSLCAGRQFLTQGMEPCIVFLNGEFWGHYEITEKMDADMIEAHYGVPEKNVCIIKKEALDCGAEEGFTEWQALRNWVAQTDFSSPEAYEQLCSRVDMQGFADYMSCEIYMNNANWGSSNMAMWKAAEPDESNPYADGKWRFLMFDTDYSTGLYGEAQASEDSFEKILKSDCFLGCLFRAALQNDGFRMQFREAFTDIAENCFSAEHTLAETERLSDAYREIALDTYNRFWCEWPGGSGAEQNYSEAVQAVRSFYERRGSFVMQYMEKHLQA